VHKHSHHWAIQNEQVASQLFVLVVNFLAVSWA